MLGIGIVGLPNVGKSTLFNALTGNNVLAANYPFATIEPNTGIVPVPDARLHQLADLYKSEKIVPATVTFVDIAGLVKDASKGEGLGNQFLAHIRSASAVVHVVRAFDDRNVVHVDETADPSRDIDVITTELILADLQAVDKRLPRLQKESRADAKLRPFVMALEQARTILDTGKPLGNAPDDQLDAAARAWLHKELQLITLKPVLYVFNVDEHGLADQPQRQALASLVAPARAMFICAKLESELEGLDADDAKELLASYGVQESGLSQLVHAAYEVLGLQSFLTAGPKEVRAWTVPRGATAPQAAGTIHGDFERGFIAAQVVDYHDLLTAGSEAAARAAGKMRTEGKTYSMQPDDVVEFRFNVSKG